MSGLTYENKNGDTVFTSAYLKNRKTCCKTSCMHCPYGHTLKTDGVQFQALKAEDIQKAQEMIDANKKEATSELSASLLAGAFGAPKKVFPVSERNMKSYMFTLIKGEICGLIKKDLTQVQEVYLLDYFKDQGLSIDIINSFYYDRDLS